MFPLLLRQRYGTHLMAFKEKNMQTTKKSICPCGPSCECGPICVCPECNLPVSD